MSYSLKPSPLPSSTRSGATDTDGAVKSTFITKLALLFETFPALSVTVYQKVYSSSERANEVGISISSSFGVSKVWLSKKVSATTTFALL